jgi:hypothetical protein
MANIYPYYRVTDLIPKEKIHIAKRWYGDLEAHGRRCFIEERKRDDGTLEYAVWRMGSGAGAADNKERCQGRIIKASDKDIKTTLKGWE